MSGLTGQFEQKICCFFLLSYIVISLTKLLLFAVQCMCICPVLSGPYLAQGLHNSIIIMVHNFTITGQCHAQDPALLQKSQGHFFWSNGKIDPTSSMIITVVITMTRKQIHYAGKL